MTKKEIEKKIKIERDLKYKDFIQFINENEFATVIDGWGNFNEDQPIHFKKIEEKKFLLFSVWNIQKRNSDLTIDLFEIIADDEYEFLEDDNFICNDLILSFDLERDKNFFFSRLSSVR